MGVASAGLAVFRFRAWEQSYSVPLMTAGTDDLQIAAIVRSVRETGWYFTNPHLGAPFGQQLYDFPHAGESLQLAAIKFLTLFSVRPYWVMNVYFLAGFAALAIVTFLVLKHLRFRFGTAAVVALLYTWLPYHFMQGQFHLFRSAYLSAPIGVLVILWVLSWKDRFLVDPDGPVWGPKRLRGNLIWRRVVGAVALCVFVGAFETMVMAFLLVALVVSALVASLAHRDVGVLGVAVAAACVIAGTFGLLFLPNLVYKVDHGPNTAAAARIPAEQTMYGLQIANMVLPVGEHPIGPLGRLQHRAQKGSPVPGEAGQNLGVLGSIGLLALLYGVIAHRLDTQVGDDFRDRKRLWVQAGLVTLVMILFSVMSGFALILSTLGLSQIRLWDRAVVVIAFCALLMVAIGLERGIDWITRRVDSTAAARGATAAVLIAVTAFGLWDTNVSYSSSRTNAAQNARATQLAGFASTVSAKLGADAMLFQLPVLPYPENPPVHDLADYDELLPYLYSGGLRFSYGATRGRPDADWQRRVDSDDPVPALAGLRGLGFDGVLVDGAGYGDGGAAVAAQLTAVLGPPVAATAGDRWQAWDLRGLATTQGSSDAALREAAVALVGPELLDRLSDD